MKTASVYLQSYTVHRMDIIDKCQCVLCLSVCKWDWIDMLTVSFLLINYISYAIICIPYTIYYNYYIWTIESIVLVHAWTVIALLLEKIAGGAILTYVQMKHTMVYRCNVNTLYKLIIQNWTHLVCNKWKYEVDHPFKSTVCLCGVLDLRISRIHLTQRLFEFWVVNE